MNEDMISLEKPHGEYDALSPCPFCGNAEIVYEQYAHGAGPRWRVWCTECLACIDPGYAQTKWPVQAMWNRRNGK